MVMGLLTKVKFFTEGCDLFFFPVLDHSAIINIFVYLWRLVV